jgi:phosphohistidine swiveling domain-containing protein
MNDRDATKSTEDAMGLISRSAAPGAVDAATVGGKAASLFKLITLGFNVPPFFVLTAAAYRRTAHGSIDAELRASIDEAVTALGGADHPYAVRSSGLAEDSADHSYAGVFDTFLDVGAATVVSAIEECLQSHQSARAAAYRQARGVADDTGMAVIVQRMVRADWAGVSFSADPLTLAMSVVVINASRGLGEDLVSGRVNPEEIRLDAVTGALLDYRLPTDSPPLPERARREVAALTLRAAERYGFPQDLEWAVEQDTLFLLQSRPITNLAGVFYNRPLEPWAGGGTPDDATRVWTRAYADEVWTPPVTPLFYDLHNLTQVTLGRIRNDGDTQPAPPDTFKYYRAAPYVDAAVLCRLYAGLPRFARRDALLALFPPEFRDRLLRAPWRSWAWIRRTMRFEIVHRRRWGITRNHRMLEHEWPKFLVKARALADFDLSALSDTALDAHLGDVWALAGSVAPECEVAVLYYAHDIKLVLSGLLDRWCGRGDQRYGDVSSGLQNSETVRETDAIWAVAAVIRESGALSEQARGTLAEFRSSVAAADETGAASAAEALRRFDAFWRDHRHRGANYKDFVYPRWGDDAELLWAHVQAFLQLESKRPLDANAQSACRRQAAQRATLGGLRGALAPLKRLVLRVLFRFNEIYAGVRDNHRYYYDHIWWLVRCAYLEMGARLQRAGLVAAADDVFFVVRSEIDELRRATLSPSAAAARISSRRREWLETKVTQPPKFLRNGYVADSSDLARAGGGLQLEGLAASGGQVTGCARVLYDVGELARVRDGEILVTRQTDPGWTPAFARIGGLVLETGGVLAHGASLCREYGLPCVTAVESATTVIRDGDRLFLDGGAGIIQILELPKPRAER